MINNLLPSATLLSGILFILSIRGLSSPKTARQSNLLGIVGMIIAVTATLFSPAISGNYAKIIMAIILGGAIGTFSALKVKMTALPQLIAILNGLGGLAAVFISSAEILSGSPAHLEASVGLIIGAITFSGSMIAFAKLQGLISANSLTYPMQKTANLLLAIIVISLTVTFVATDSLQIFAFLAGTSLLLGLLLVLPIGGADMPVIISVLNAFSGWAAVGIGFSISNILLIIIGTLVGAGGTILSYVMCKSMNRSLIDVMFGSMSHSQTNTLSQTANGHMPHIGNPRDAAFIMENAHQVIIVPGYGMAVAQAQHILREMASILHERYGVNVKFAIHPVAGRMPGHMNVLLAEANVPYENVYELDNINREFPKTDVAYVIGANDITNPLAKTDPSSPIYGMPILDVEKAKTVFFVKRSLAPGYSGLDNPLFFADNTIMLYGDAKKVTEEIVAALEK